MESLPQAATPKWASGSMAVTGSFRADNTFVDILIETIKSDDSDTESFVESIHLEVRTICTESKNTAGWSAP